MRRILPTQKQGSHFDLSNYQQESDYSRWWDVGKSTNIWFTLHILLKRGSNTLNGVSCLFIKRYTYRTKLIYQTNFLWQSPASSGSSHLTAVSLQLQTELSLQLLSINCLPTMELFPGHAKTLLAMGESPSSQEIKELLALFQQSCCTIQSRQPLFNISC